SSHTSRVVDPCEMLPCRVGSVELMIHAVTIESALSQLK
ncbi:hypothetical protein A2U01_0091894, partial [Trifolium medium]|nr:hypothetical protein [Trifolium medium]